MLLSVSQDIVHGRQLNEGLWHGLRKICHDKDGRDGGQRTSTVLRVLARASPEGVNRGLDQCSCRLSVDRHVAQLDECTLIEADFRRNRNADLGRQ